LERRGRADRSGKKQQELDDDEEPSLSPCEVPFKSIFTDDSTIIFGETSEPKIQPYRSNGLPQKPDSPGSQFGDVITGVLKDTLSSVKASSPRRQN
jgi:hypothetical protein